MTRVGDTYLEFDNGAVLYSEHHPAECWEEHYLSFGDLSEEDFEGLEFNLSGHEFFERVPGFGIRLVPVNGHPVAIPGYWINNGYYSDELALVLQLADAPTYLNVVWDIKECQNQEEY